MSGGSYEEERRFKGDDEQPHELDGPRLRCKRCLMTWPCPAAILGPDTEAGYLHREWCPAIDHGPDPDPPDESACQCRVAPR